MNGETSILNREREVQVKRGSVMLPVVIALLLGGLTLLIYPVAKGDAHWEPVVAGILTVALSFTLMMGFFTLQPNEARVLILFGKYKGTVRQSGFHWGNPFYANTLGRNKISLRARTLQRGAAQSQ